VIHSSGAWLVRSFSLLSNSTLIPVGPATSARPLFASKPSRQSRTMEVTSIER
jgi:hypothetical protein